MRVFVAIIFSLTVLVAGLSLGNLCAAADGFQVLHSRTYQVNAAEPSQEFQFDWVPTSEGGKMRLEIETNGISIGSKIGFACGRPLPDGETIVLEPTVIVVLNEALGLVRDVPAEFRSGCLLNCNLADGQPFSGGTIVVRQVVVTHQGL